jgi:hypothetical protein
MPICLVTDSFFEAEHKKKLFDVVQLPTLKSITQNDKTEYIKAKLFMYDYSPFNETIFLDVDQIVIAGRKLAPIFEELVDVDLTFSNTGIAKASIWAKIDEVKSIYGDKQFYNFHSEFVYFKKKQGG